VPQIVQVRDESSPSVSNAGLDLAVDVFSCKICNFPRALTYPAIIEHSHAGKASGVDRAKWDPTVFVLKDGGTIASTILESLNMPRSVTSKDVEGLQNIVCHYCDKMFQKPMGFFKMVSKCERDAAYIILIPLPG